MCCINVINVNIININYCNKTSLSMWLTFISTRYSKKWVVIESWEEVLVGSTDVFHPFEQIDGSWIVKSEVHKLTTESRMCRSFCYHKIVRWFALQLWRSPVLVAPSIHCPWNWTTTKQQQTSLFFQSLVGPIKWFTMADIDIIASITAKNNHIDT